MADLITWGGGGGISLYAKSTEIRGVKDISIKVAADIEDSTQGSEKYTKKKNAGGYEISMNVVLNAVLGVDVQGVAIQISEAARCGSTGYFYTAGEKLFPSKFMAVSAEISNIQMTSTGIWKYCEVSWTLKQCSKYDGTTGRGSTGGGGGGTGTGSKVSSKTKTAIVATATTGAAIGAGAAATISYDFMTAAKLASATAYKTLTTPKVNKPWTPAGTGKAGSPTTSQTSKLKQLMK